MMEDICEDVEIPIWIGSKQKWLTGLTKRTTCDDVIYALLYNEDITDDVSYSYTIFERWHDVERPLQGRTKIVKIWRSWGVDQVNVKLSMRRIDETTFSGECSNRSRRHRKSRSRRESHVMPCLCPQCQKKEKCVMTQSVEELRYLVISQERDIQELYERIHGSDSAIDEHEDKLHQMRLETNGKNYVQDAYLEDNKYSDSLTDKSIDEILNGVEPKYMTTYLQTCEKIIQLDECIAQENNKIATLKSAWKKQMASYDSATTNRNESLKLNGDKLRWEINEMIASGISIAVELEENTQMSTFLENEIYKRQNSLDCLLKELESDGGNCNATLLNFKHNKYTRLKQINHSVSSEILDNSIITEENKYNLHKTKDDRFYGSADNLYNSFSRFKERSRGWLTSNHNSGQTKEPNNNMTYKTRTKTPLPVDAHCNSAYKTENGYTADERLAPDNIPKFVSNAKNNSDKNANFFARRSEMFPPNFDALNVNRDALFVTVPRVTSEYSSRLKVMTNTQEENDSNSDTGLSSMHSDDAVTPTLETLV